MVAEALGFVFMDASDLVVTDQDDTVLDMGTDYEILGDARSGNAEIRALRTFGSTEVLTITRVTAMQQQTLLEPQKPLPAVAIMTELDRGIMIGQEISAVLAELGARALRVPAGETIGPIPALEARKGQLLGFDAATGEPSVTSVQQAIDATIEAVRVALMALAAAAAASAGNAAASEASSAASATASALSSATSEAASGPTYASTAAGLAATPSGQSFAVDNGDGTVTVWLNDAGVAVEQRTLATTDYLASSAGAGAVGFVQSGTGAIDSTVDAKLKRAPISPAEYKLGIDADDTNSLKKCFDYALANRKAVRLSGDYVVSGPIATVATVAAGSVDIEVVGNCSITVDAGAAAFDHLLFVQTTAANSFSISGGSLTIDLNSKAANGLYIRHLAASRGGICNITAPVTVKNAKNNNAASTSENAGVSVFGNYETIYLNSPRVESVQRTNAGGACKGISISGFSGAVTIDNPHVSNILAYGAGADADGIVTFAQGWSSSPVRTEGTVVINGGTFIDCQGRSFKSQCSNVALIRPVVKRKMVVAIANSCEFDFQAGNGLVIEPDIEYLANGGTSPLGSSHSIASFQHLITDSPSVGRMVGGTLRTNVAIPRAALHVTGAASESGTTIVDGLRVIAVGSFATAAFSRAIAEVDASQMEACGKKNRIVVNNVQGPLGAYGIGYTSFGGSSLASKFSWSVTNLRNTLGASSTAQTCKNLSGTAIGAFEKFMVRDNEGYRDLFSSLTFSMAALEVGCRFTAEIASCTVTNAPGWGSSGYALVECKSGYFGATDRGVLVTKDNAAAANTMFWTRDGGTTWGTIK